MNYRQIQKTRALYESLCGPDRKNTAGRLEFVNTFRRGLGLCDEHGYDYRDRAGNRKLGPTRDINPAMHSVQELCESIIGPDWRRYMDPANPGSLRAITQHNLQVAAMFGDDRRALLEATGVGVDVSAFANINAWTGVVGGLIERKILEQFEDADFIGDDLMPDEPTKVQEGQKVIGIQRIGDVAEERQPGEPHKRVETGERYVVLPKTRENALAMDVTKEAAFFDLTGQLFETAEMTGKRVAFRKEFDKIDAVIGISTINANIQNYDFRWKYGSTSAVTTFDLYSSAGQTIANSTLTNKQTGNSLQDWTNIQNAWLLAQRVQDPEAKTRVGVKLDRILVNPASLVTAQLIIGALSNERRSAGSSTQSTAATLQIGQTTGSPVEKMFPNLKLLWSPYVEQRTTDATGLNQGQTAANNFWWMFQFGRAFKYMQNWPLTVAQAPTNSYEMLDRGLVMTIFANERGCPSVWSPFHAFEFTG